MIAHDNPWKRRTFFGLLSSLIKTQEKNKTKEKEKRAEKKDKKIAAKRRMLTDKMSIDRYWK